MRVHNAKYFKIGLVLFIIGLSGIILPFISFGVSEDYTILQAIAEQRQQQSLEGQFIKEAPGTESAESVPKPTTRPDPNFVNIKNRLIIPKAGIDMPIFEGDSANLLLKGGWIFPGTAHPGQPGNSVIFGHRFRYLPPITNTFYSLDKVVVGDIFTVAWNGQVFNYAIKEIKVIEPTDFSVLKQSDVPLITLITCAPLFSTKQRLVVVGSLLP